MKFRLAIVNFSFLFLMSGCIHGEETLPLQNKSVGQTPEVLFPNNGQSATFLVLGDYGEGDSNQKSVASLLEKLCTMYAPDAILAVGDNIYPRGVTSENDSQWKTKFESVYAAPCTASKQWIAALGNHDHDGNPDAEVAYSKKNSRWVMPARSFAAHFGQFVDIFVIDSNTDRKCAGPDCRFANISKIASKSVAPWKIVLAHHPLVSAGKHTTTPNGYAEKFVPFYCEGKMDFVFNGHDHNLQHNVGNMLGSSCSMNEVISGAGGAQLYDVKPIPEITKFALSKFGLAVVRFEGKKATVKFHTVAGGEAYVYAFEVKK